MVGERSLLNILGGDFIWGSSNGGCKCESKSCDCHVMHCLLCDGIFCRLSHHLSYSL